jgi:hypothetical protein
MPPLRKTRISSSGKRLPSVRRIQTAIGSYDRSGEFAMLSTYLAAVSFLVGIGAPCFTMIPKLGEGIGATVVGWFVGDSLEPQSFSLTGGILHLLQEGEYLIGGLLLVFSVLFPLAKLVVIFVLLHASREMAQPLVGLLANLGKWSMLDVFVIAAVVICFKGFPGGSRVEVEWGLYVFAASVILSMLATHFLKRHISQVCTS